MTEQTPSGAGASYAAAGVDIEAGDRAVELFKPLASKATRPEVRGGLGGFAGLFALRGGYREPVLASSTDGVGTKLAVAQAMDKHDTVGLDLVAMVVDDLVVCGAEPLFLQDYIAVGRTLGEELLEPTRIYAKDCLALAAETQVRTFCHVTGGGLAGNLERVIPHGLLAEVDRGTWTPAPVFGMIAQRGRIDRSEMEKTFNMGVGMIAVVAPEDTDRALAILTARHLNCWILGTVKKGGKDGPRAELMGQHPRF